MLKDGRHGIFVSSRELKAQGTDCHSEQLVFQVLRLPHYGYLENVTSGEPWAKRHWVQLKYVSFSFVMQWLV